MKRRFLLVGILVVAGCEAGYGQGTPHEPALPTEAPVERQGTSMPDERPGASAPDQPPQSPSAVGAGSDAGTTLGVAKDKTVIRLKLDDGPEQEYASLLRIRASELSSQVELNFSAGRGEQTWVLSLIAPLGQRLSGSMFILGRPYQTSSSIMLLKAPSGDDQVTTSTLSSESGWASLTFQREQIAVSLVAQLKGVDGSSHKVQGELSGNYRFSCDVRSTTGGLTGPDGVSRTVVEDRELEHPVCREARAMLD